MKFMQTVLLAVLTTGSALVLADNTTRGAVTGGGFGGALGGYIGSKTGGKTGGIIGSAAGAALGSAIMIESDHRSGRRGGDDLYDFDAARPHFKKLKKCPPGLAMQGRC